MMVRPWANAIAAIPLRPTPSPTTAAAPAPMNTNEKVPMNSARSLGAVLLDIVHSRDEMITRCHQVADGPLHGFWTGRRHVDAAGLTKAGRPTPRRLSAS